MGTRSERAALVVGILVGLAAACGPVDSTGGADGGGTPSSGGGTGAEGGGTALAAGGQGGSGGGAEEQGGGTAAPGGGTTSSGGGLVDAGHSDAGVTDAGHHDAGSPPSDAGAPDAGCGPYASYSIYNCSGDGNARLKCAGNQLSTQSCANGCLREPTGTEDVCMGTTTSFSCTGSYGTTKARNGDYFITAFGCWKDASGVAHGDPGDNCIPSCLSTLKTLGLCPAGDTGKACEERLTWYTADAARFGCGNRVRIENPKTGKKVVAVVIDLGPACFVENGVNKAVLDTSGRIDRLLFGADQGAVDKALVHVVEVDRSTPLGPVP